MPEELAHELRRIEADCAYLPSQGHPARILHLTLPPNTGSAAVIDRSCACRPLTATERHLHG